MSWRPQSFAQIAKTLKDDPDGTGQALDQTLQYFSGQIAERQAAQGAGTTTQRPSSPSQGWMYFDTNLGKPIWWDGKSWRDATGTVV